MRAESGGRAELATERLSSLTEHDFWEAARAELLDTAEPVRHRSCISELDTACPSEMSKLSMVADKMQHTPEPRMNKGLVPPSGIGTEPLIEGQAFHGAGKNGSPGRIRTYDISINSRTLYR